MLERLLFVSEQWRMQAEGLRGQLPVGSHFLATNIQWAMSNVNQFEMQENQFGGHHFGGRMWLVGD